MIEGTLGLTVKEYGPTMNQLKMIACCERPQERLEAFGASALSDTELLAILLRSGTQGYDVLTLASRLIAEAGSLARLAAWTDSDFRRLKGIGRVKGGQLVAMMEIARRVIGKPSEEGPVLNRADLVANYLRPYTVGLDVEKFWVLCLNRKNRLMKRVEITSGTATATLAHPREVFRAAIRESACAIVASHSHPSGDPASSSADVEITRLLREAAKTVEITLADHVIVGRVGADPLGIGYFSFREAGLL
jgi:DNA repair protein RadC